MSRLIPVRPAGDAVQLARVKAIQGFHSAWRQRPGLAPMHQCGADACCVEAQFQLAGEPVVAPNVAQGAGTLACNGHAMAHVSRVVAVTGEAAPEVVELVDHLEWLALQDDRLHQRSGHLPLRQLYSSVG